MTGAVTVVIRAEMRAWRNRARASPGRVVGLALLIGVGTLILGGTLFGVAFAAGGALPSARDSILAGAFTGLSVMMLVVGFPSVIGSYFAGRDLLQLVLAPISTREIFVARSLFAMSANVLVALLFLVFVAGLGAGSGASPLYYALALGLVAVQVLLVTALQVDVMAGVLRWVPARIAREVAVAVASIVGAGLYAAWNLTFRQTVIAARQKLDLTQLVAALRQIDWLPSSWPGHALAALIAGDALQTLLWTAATLALCAALALVAALLYERTLLLGLGILGNVGPARRRRAPQQVRVARGGAGSPALAIARKDWIVYRRDIRRLSRFLPALLFVFVYGFALFRPARGIDPLWSGVFVVAFVSFFMSLVFATTSIPSERRGFQILRLAPITAWELLRTKIAFTLIPVLTLSFGMAIVTAVLGGDGAARTAGLALLSLWIGLGCVCIGVSAGAIDPRFESTDDRRSVGVVGTFIAMGAELAFALLSIAAFGLAQLAVQLAGGSGGFGFLPATPAVAAVIGVVGLVLAAGGAVVVVVVLSAAASRLRTFEGTIGAT